MTRIVEPVLFASESAEAGWSLAELDSARLDGELVAFGGAYVPVDEPDRPELRALTLSPLLGSRGIASGRTAAWVHGASSRPPAVVDAHATTGAGALVRAGVRVHDVAVPDADVVTFGAGTRSVRVTSPLRTVLDLVDRRTAGDADALLVASLCERARLTIGDCLAYVDALRRRPGKRAAAERLTAIAAAFSLP